MVLGASNERWQAGRVATTRKGAWEDRRYDTRSSSVSVQVTFDRKIPSTWCTGKEVMDGASTAGVNLSYK